MSFERYELQIFDVCQEIHMHTTGSSDCVHPVDVDKFSKWLKMRLESWSVSVGCRWHEFDEVARKLCVEALKEWSKYKKEMGYPPYDTPPEWWKKYEKQYGAI